MKAIQVKVLPATNTKPTRVKAMAEGVKPLVVSVDCNGIDFCASEAAHMLASQYDWFRDGRRLADGMLPNGDRVFCFVDDTAIRSVAEILKTPAWDSETIERVAEVVRAYGFLPEEP